MTHIALPRAAAHIAPTGLRAYPRNTSPAAARIVAMALISNGRIKAVEGAALDAADAHAWLGIARHDWYAVVGHLRADLLRAGHAPGGPLPRAGLERLLDDVTDKDLQRVVAALSVAVIHADGRVASGEQALLAALQRRWGVPVHPQPYSVVLRERALSRSSVRADETVPLRGRIDGDGAAGYHAGVVRRRSSTAISVITVSGSTNPVIARV